MPVNKNWLVSQLGMVSSPSWVVSYPDFTDAQYTDAPVGSEVVYTNVAADGSYGTHIHFYKVSNTGTTSDWWGKGHIYETFGVADMTDGGSTSGTFVFTQDIPALSTVYRTVYRNVTGFAGDTSAAAEMGDGSDADRYNASSDPSLFASSAALDGGLPQGVAYNAAAVSPTVTITSASDFTSVVSNGSGAATAYLYFETHA